jgi:hypothetical protein
LSEQTHVCLVEKKINLFGIQKGGDPSL